VSYVIEFSDRALEQLKKLERGVQERIVAALERIRVRPMAYIQRLVGTPLYRLRVSDYRIIMDIDKGRLLVLVITLGHRRSNHEW